MAAAQQARFDSAGGDAFAFPWRSHCRRQPVQSDAGRDHGSADVAGTQEFFGIRKWPEDIGQIDLGGRVIDVIPIPGHDTLSIALYDRQTGILFSGDSLYPGRVFVRDFDAFLTQQPTPDRFHARQDRDAHFGMPCRAEHDALLGLSGRHGVSAGGASNLPYVARHSAGDERGPEGNEREPGTSRLARLHDLAG